MSTLCVPSAGYAAQKLSECQREREGLKPRPIQTSRSTDPPVRPPLQRLSHEQPQRYQTGGGGASSQRKSVPQGHSAGGPLAAFGLFFSPRRISAAAVPLGILSNVGFLQRLFINPAPPHCQFPGVGVGGGVFLAPRLRESRLNSFNYRSR